MAMINQLLRGNGQPLPYFIIAPPNSRRHTSACLTLGYVYPCSAHCSGLSVSWPTLQQTLHGGGNATAVAPMILLDLAQQLAQDIAEFSPVPHVQLDAQEREQWRQLYLAITNDDPEEPRHVRVRDELRQLHTLAMDRQNYYASLRRLAPAPPRPNPRPPKPGPSNSGPPNSGMLAA